VESPQTVTISGGTGYFEVTVTAGDKVNTKTYTISFTEAPDNDATLSDLKVDGETISGFAPNIYEYSVVVPYGTATVPTVSATTTDPNANAETTQATSFTDPDNVATVVGHGGRRHDHEDLYGNLYDGTAEYRCDVKRPARQRRHCAWLCCG
jgi:hypothetical protein